MNKKLIIAVVLLILIVGGYFVAKAVKHSMTPPPVAVPVQQVATPTSSTPTSSAPVQKITVSGTEFAFTPSTITVKAGQPVQVTFKNAGAYPHNFTLTDLNVQTKTIQPGEQDVITFTPTKTGSFSYICTVPGHADRGMKGTLIVQ